MGWRGRVCCGRGCAHSFFLSAAQQRGKLFFLLDGVLLEGALFPLSRPLSLCLSQSERTSEETQKDASRLINKACEWPSGTAVFHPTLAPLGLAAHSHLRSRLTLPGRHTEGLVAERRLCSSGAVVCWVAGGTCRPNSARVRSSSSVACLCRTPPRGGVPWKQPRHHGVYVMPPLCRARHADSLAHADSIFMQPTWMTWSTCRSCRKRAFWRICACATSRRSSTYAAPRVDRRPRC